RSRLQCTQPVRFSGVFYGSDTVTLRLERAKSGAFVPPKRIRITRKGPMLTPRFEEALTYAAAVHAGQLRKRSSIPYVSHLLIVAGTALEYGATEDVAIAALLHDAVEDAGGRERAADIRLRFGERVAAIVLGCSDTDATPKP